MSIGDIHENASLEELRGILLNGLTYDFYNAECYYTIYKIIGGHSENINKTQNKNIIDFFSIYYKLAQDAAILSIARMYDTSKNTKTRCIPYLLKRLDDLSSMLPSIEAQNMTINLLKNYNVPEQYYLSVKDPDASKFPKEIAYYYKTLYTEKSLDSKNQSLKKFRDKIIAHNDMFDGNTDFTWSIYEELIGFANEIIDIIVTAYFNTSILISRDAEYKALSIEVMLNKLNL